MVLPDDKFFPVSHYPQKAEIDSASDKASATGEREELDPADEDLPGKTVLFQHKGENHDDRNNGTGSELALVASDASFNVFNVIKVVWKRDKTFKVDDDLNRATLFLMMLATEKSDDKVPPCFDKTRWHSER